MGEPTPELTARCILRAIGYGGANPVHLRDGREHHLFRVTLREGEYVLKFPKEDGLSDPHDPTRTPRARLVAEAAAIGLCRDVPVPKPHRVYGTDPVSALMPFVPGTTAEIAYEKEQLDEESLLGVCVQMGRTLAAIHSRRRVEGLLPDVVGCDLERARLLHMDFHLGNVIGVRHLAGGWVVTGVVDWTCARFGPPEADLVEMQVSVFVSNPRARDALVAGYRQVALRSFDLQDVEHRAAAEMRRRMDADRPDEKTVAAWLRWLEGRPV